MSVLIKGMKMPINCGDCFLKVCYDYYYDAEPIYCSQVLDAEGRMLKIGVAGKPMNDIHQCCPLIEVPTPHGRLIDEDAVIANIVHNLGVKDASYLLQCEKAIVKYIKETPLVIETEVQNG